MKLLVIVGFLLGCNLSLSHKFRGSKYPRAVTPLGTIEGLYNTSYSGKTYAAFMGIPYAKPPVGKFRFEVAKPIRRWSGVLMAKEFGSICMQYNFNLRDPADRIEGSEDCLYMNIYTPATAVVGFDKLLPVVFFIPGGVFLIGNGNLHRPHYIMDNDVILVTFNYRLGPLGFLSTEDDIVPGNMGLKDQVIAMRWVYDNIKAFGGDPSRISIFGQSAGAVSVHYHYLSKLSRSMFQRGMSMSGTAMSPWALAENPLQKAKKLATIVGCPVNKVRQMVNCLKSRPATHIVNAIRYFTAWYYIPANGFGPSVEKGNSEFTFIEREPIDIITSGDAYDVPWVVGVTDSEGLINMAPLFGQEELFEPLNKNWETLAPRILHFVDTIPDEYKGKAANLMKQYYLGDHQFGKSTFNQTKELTGDRLFVYPSTVAANEQARSNESPVYAYYFSYRGAHSLSELLSGTNENLGACHGDDLNYVLNPKFIDSSSIPTPEDEKMQKLMTNIWVSFATNGTFNVGVEWSSWLDKYSDNGYNYLHIGGPDKIAMENNPNLGNVEFWRNIPFGENNIPSF